MWPWPRASLEWGESPCSTAIPCAPTCCPRAPREAVAPEGTARAARAVAAARAVTAVGAVAARAVAAVGAAAAAAVGVGEAGIEAARGRGAGLAAAARALHRHLGGTGLRGGAGRAAG